MKTKSRHIILSSVIILGIILRLWKLYSLPNGIDGDVIISATNSLHIFNGLDFKFFQNNKIIGHPVAYLFWCMPLGSFLIATFMNVFRQPELGALFSSAIVGILTIPLVYLLSRILLDEKTALLASFLFAVSPYHLVYSRSGFTHITLIVPLVVFSMYLLKRTVDTSSFKLFYLSGLIWGLILFNSYPIAYIVAPITVIYLLWLKRWRWLFSKEFVLGAVISVLTFLTLAIGFALLNRSSDLFIVLKESYYQWIAVRLNETQQNTTIIKNILGGIQMLFVTVRPEYQFGVLRIFHFPLFDYLVGFTFVIGILASIVRRNTSDKLLVLWVISAFLVTSVINIPQERYFFVLLPVPYLFSASVLSVLFEGATKKWKLSQFVGTSIILILSSIYVFQITYRQYFISYAANNANMIHGLGDREVADFLDRSFDYSKTLILTSMELPGVNLNSGFKLDNMLVWSDFIKNVSALSKKFTAKGHNLPEYKDHTVDAITDGDLATFWYGRVPTRFQLSAEKNEEISSIVSFFSSTGPSRALAQYSIAYLDEIPKKWTELTQGSNESGINGIALRDLDLQTKQLDFTITDTIANDSLQMVEEIMIFNQFAKGMLIPKNIFEIVLVLALNPNFRYYGNYDDRAKIMRMQADILFGELKSKLVKTFYGNNREVIYEIYSIKVDDIRL